MTHGRNNLRLVYVIPRSWDLATKTTPQERLLTGQERKNRIPPVEVSMTQDPNAAVQRVASDSSKTQNPCLKLAGTYTLNAQGLPCILINGIEFLVW